MDFVNGMGKTLIHQNGRYIPRQIIFYKPLIGL